MKSEIKLGKSDLIEGTKRPETSEKNGLPLGNKSTLTNNLSAASKSIFSEDFKLNVKTDIKMVNIDELIFTDHPIGA